jgi:hypothetical protein
LPTKAPGWFDRIDRRITETMADHGLTLLRFALGIVFFWFGVLKFFPGASDRPRCGRDRRGNLNRKEETV